MDWRVNPGMQANGKTMPVSGNKFPGPFASDRKTKANPSRIG